MNKVVGAFVFCAIWFFCASNGLLAQENTKSEQNASPDAVVADEFNRVFSLAVELGKRGRTEEAVKNFEKAIELKKGQCADCFQGIGQAYFQVTRYRDAATALKQAIALKPQNEAALTNMLGVSLYLQDDRHTLDEAIASFRRAIELSGDKLSKVHMNLGYALIKAEKESEGKTELKKYLEMEPKAANADDVKAVLANPKMIKARFATDFKVKTMTGTDISLKSLRGKIVLLDFWATWCGPCRVELPAVKAIWDKYKDDKNFVMVGISLDEDKKAFNDFIKKHEMSWMQYFDGGGWENKVASLYGVHSIPFTVLVDEEGVIKSTGLRGVQLYNKIGELLNRLKEKPGEGTK